MSGLEDYVNETFKHQDFNLRYGTDEFLYATCKTTGETFVLIDQCWVGYDEFCDIEFLTHQY